MNQLKQPFNYSLRISKRARHVRLAVKPFVGLEVVIPKRFPKKQIAKILHQHENWITTQLQKHAQSFKQPCLPQALELAYTGETFSIVYRNAAKQKVCQQQDKLTIHHQHDQQAIDQLRHWCRQKAKQVLMPHLSEVADEIDLKFSRAIIRSQKSRWGSCSSSGTISLNDQLLFLPAASVRYLMIHELCHTRHMNHSASFWQLVENYCPDYQQHEQLLNQGRERVPDWFIKSLYC